uniref:Centrosomal protein of 164 kDa n=1 Tax=Leptobrachium leishanense TaxID=445787 RepID=A0A8C5R8X2_9ANUR
MGASAIRIGDQLILEEDYDENYIPQVQEILEYARMIGIDPDSEPELMWLAREGIVAPLPPEWKPCQDVTGDIYYFNFTSGQSSWDHPSDEHYRDLVTTEREKLQAHGDGKKKERKKKKEKEKKKEKKVKDFPKPAMVSVYKDRSRWVMGHLPSNPESSLGSPLGPVQGHLGSLAPLKGLEMSGGIAGMRGSLSSSAGSSGGFDTLLMGASKFDIQGLIYSYPLTHCFMCVIFLVLVSVLQSPRGSARLLKNLHMDIGALGEGFEYEVSGCVERFINLSCFWTPGRQIVFIPAFTLLCLTLYMGCLFLLVKDVPFPLTIPQMRDLLQEKRQEVQREHERKLERLKEEHNQVLERLRIQLEKEEQTQRSTMLEKIQEEIRKMTQLHERELDAQRLDLEKRKEDRHQLFQEMVISRNTMVRVYFTDTDFHVLVILTPSPFFLLSVRHYISSQGSSIQKAKDFLRLQTRSMCRRHTLLQAAKQQWRHDIQGSLDRENSKLLEGMKKNIEEEVRSLDEIQSNMEKGRVLVQEKEQCLQELQNDLLPSQVGNSHKMQSLVESMQHLTSDLNKVLTTLGPLAYNSHSSLHSQTLPQALSGIPLSTYLSMNRATTPAAAPPPSKWAWDSKFHSGLPSTSTPAKQSADAILLEKWRKYFPGGSPSLIEQHQQTENKLGYVPAGEQVRMIQNATSHAPHTDNRRMQAMIDANKKWLENFRNDPRVPLLSRVNRNSAAAGPVQLGLDENNQIKVFHY